VCRLAGPAGGAIADPHAWRVHDDRQAAGLADWLQLAIIANADRNT
jgi:hypothetical protein